MPKKVNSTEVKKKWNFYMPQLLKLEMQHKLLYMNLENKQSALIRALIRMFVNNEVDNRKILEYVQAETYITPTGKESKL